VLVTPQEDGSISVKGDPDHPSNKGRLCSKGSALSQTTGLEERLLVPSIGGKEADWGEALDLVATRFSQAIEEHGPESVAIYAAGQILTEDYYVANKWMKGFVGSANIDTNSRLCMASSVAGHKRAFGTDTVPGCYSDLEDADLITIVGSNLAWCHPVLFQRIEAEKQNRPSLKIVVIDPRQTATTSLADLHLPIAPDGDAALFNGLLDHLASHGILDEAYIAAHTSGFEEALKAAQSQSAPDQLSKATGLDASQVADFYRLFASHEKSVTIYSQGVNQSIGGTDKVNAILNCHLATGRIGKVGAGPFSVTGQPNAMGGREVGGLANMLAAHLDFGREDHWHIVSDFWDTPNLAKQPGLKAVDLFKAVRDGKIKALWIMSTNPVVSMPQANDVAKALELCPFVVVSEVCAVTDTARYADVLLPSADWGEKDGTVTNSERRISRQRRFRQPAGQAKPDWWQICEVAKRMGYSEAFAYQSNADIFAEHAALSGYENRGSRDFDISAHAEISQVDYDALKPFQWPQTETDGVAETRFFSSGNFYTPDRRGRFIAVQNIDDVTVPKEASFILNTGRLRDQWHTMTRTGKAAGLMQHMAEPFAEIHPLDAKALDIEDAQIVELSNELSGEAVSVRLRAMITERVQQGQIFVPFHWNDHYASHGRIDALVAANRDPISGQPASKMSRVQLRSLDMGQYGYALVKEKPQLVEADYWACARVEQGWQVEFAFFEPLENPADFAQSLLHGSSELAHLADAAKGIDRFLSGGEDGLDGLVYLAPSPVLIARSWAAGLFSQSALSVDGHKLLAGCGGQDGPDKGAIICSCFSVGALQIQAAIQEEGCKTETEIGQALKAGTNCGSCRSEIRQLIAAEA
jgi:assimilatory nitrate reductase catalytic subunit